MNIYIIERIKDQKIILETSNIDEIIDFTTPRMGVEIFYLPQMNNPSIQTQKESFIDNFKKWGYIGIEDGWESSIYNLRVKEMSIENNNLKDQNYIIAKEIYKKLTELSEDPRNSWEEILEKTFKPYGVEIEK